MQLESHRTEMELTNSDPVHDHLRPLPDRARRASRLPDGIRKDEDRILGRCTYGDVGCGCTQITWLRGEEALGILTEVAQCLIEDRKDFVQFGIILKSLSSLTSGP